MKGSTTKRCPCPARYVERNGQQIKQTCKKPHGSWSFQIDIRITPPGRPTYGSRPQLKIGGYKTQADAEKASREALTLLDIPGTDDDRARVEVADAIRGAGREKRPFPTEADMRRRYGGGAVLAGKETVAEYLDRWLTQRIALGKIREGTSSHYRLYFTRWKTILGHIRLVDLRPTHISNGLSELAQVKGRRANAGTLQPGSLILHLAGLSSALSSAHLEGLISSNPAVIARKALPEATRPRVMEISRADLERLLRHAADHRLGPLIMVAIFCGLRRGELCGLRWADIDLQGRILTVRWQLDRHCQLVRVKTKNSEGRQIGLSAPLIEMLHGVRLIQEAEKVLAGDAYEDRGFVFTRDALGNPVRLEQATEGVIKLIRECGFDQKMTLHTLRHCYASIAMAAGVPMKVISMTMGHSEASFTMNTYGHLLTGATVEAAEQVQEVMPVFATIPRPSDPTPVLAAHPLRRKAAGGTIIW